MGFAAADINHWLPYLDDTFYRRVFTDARVGFLAELFSPRLRLFRGGGWARLWDMFLSCSTGSDDWWSRTRAAALAHDLLTSPATVG